MTNWLAEEEMAAWLPLIRTVQLLPRALDRQLRDEAGISHTYYLMLAMLSEREGWTLSMGELADKVGASPSRLTHAIAAMEAKGWLTRSPCATDRRVQFCTLTDAGYAVVRRVAPQHVEEVRRLVFDRLSPEQVGQLRDIAATLAGGLE